jgi:hypothetical protein
MNSLLKVANELDKCGQYELSDKLFSIAQNQTQQLVDQGVSQAISAKSQYDTAKVYLDATEKVSKVLGSYLPKVVKTFEDFKSVINKFENIPAVDKILGALDLKSFVDNSISFIKKVQMVGLSNYFKTNAKEVIDFFVSLASTVNMIAGYIPPFLPLKPQLEIIDKSLSAYSVAVGLTDTIGTYSGTTNTHLQNFTSPSNKQETKKPFGWNTGAGGAGIKSTTLVGEVFNTLLDYVNGKGKVVDLINKHIPDSDPQKPEKIAQVFSYVRQKKFPQKNAPYQTSSYYNRKRNTQLRRERQIAIDGGFGSDAQDPIFWSDPYKPEDEKD